MHVQKAPSWLRAVQMGLGALTIALSIFALVEFQSSPYVSRTTPRGYVSHPLSIAESGFYDINFVDT